MTERLSEYLSDRPDAGVLDGTEGVTMVKDGEIVQAPASSVAALAGGVQTIDGNAPDEAGDVDLTGTYGPMPEGTPEVGQVPIVTDDSPLTLGWGDAGGGGAAGAAVVLACPFTFDTPGILTGAALYTPAVGDVLLDAWISIETAWDGTTPKGDFGPFLFPNPGALNGLGNGAVNMAIADGGHGFSNSTWSSSNQASSLSSSIISAYSGVPTAQLPLKLGSADPIKVVVSQDGRNDGADPGSTQGSAVLYLLMATPA